MLNYIWIGLIIIGLFVAIGNDVADEVKNPYRNGEILVGTVLLKKAPSGIRQTWEGDLVLAPAEFNAFYGASRALDAIQQPVIISTSTDGSSSLLMNITEASPAWWRELVKSAASKERLMGRIVEFAPSEDRTSARLQVVLESIRFVKLKAVTQAALDYAAIAVNIALGLIGIMALWLGVMKVAEEAGLLHVLTRLLAPLTKRIFPDVPPDHPAVGAMIMNTAANMLGLSNAATPLGLKAMEELNKLNKKLGTATDAMCTFLVINTSNVQIIPATVIAIRAAAGSAQPTEIIGPVIVATVVALTVGVTTAKLLAKLPVFRKQLLTESGI